MTSTKYIIGRGELLTYPIDAPGGGGDKAYPYSLQESKVRLRPKIAETIGALLSLPDEACPYDIAVAEVTLHPTFIAKSFFPAAFLRQAGLASIGSKTVRVSPEKDLRKKKRTEESDTTRLFVAGARDSFSALPDLIDSLKIGSREAIQFSEIEDFAAYKAEEKMRGMEDYEGQYFEVGLHLLPDASEESIRSPFFQYARSLGFQLYEKFSFRAGNLLFVPVKGEKHAVADLAKFSMLRVIRPVPKLRSHVPVVRTNSIRTPFITPLAQPLSSDPRVAILDGGIPDVSIISPWVNRSFVSDATAESVPNYVDHGLAVTSAYLFGPIAPGSQAERPFSYVDHHRVLDAVSDTEPPMELYRTLGHIEDILLSHQYEFINLSLGPALPIEDTEVHAWTSVIDERLSDGNTFMTVAAGNNGQNDVASGNARIQVPSDCVNAVAVGAADRTGSNWNRAPYSAMGPGRAPGIKKPDLVAFGGSASEYFHVAGTDLTPNAIPNQGTSFSAPYVLRTAVGVRAVLGAAVHPLTIKALLVHSADAHSTSAAHEIGWGKAAEDLNKIIICPDGMARIIYQGSLVPGKYLRAPVPLPKGAIKGKVRLTATFCYASPTDPQDSAAYTRAGLGITFRPHSQKFAHDEAENPKSRTFFPQSEFKTEAELRNDLGKWETVLHASDSLLGTSLHEATFDIHYNAREGGMNAKDAQPIRYALVLTIEAPKHKDIYDEIMAANDVLVSLQPTVSVPIRS